MTVHALRVARLQAYNPIDLNSSTACCGAAELSRVSKAGLCHIGLSQCVLVSALAFVQATHCMDQYTTCLVLTA